MPECASDAVMLCLGSMGCYTKAESREKIPPVQVTLESQQVLQRVNQNCNCHQPLFAMSSCQSWQNFSHPHLCFGSVARWRHPALEMLSRELASPVASILLPPQASAIPALSGTTSLGTSRVAHRLSGCGTLVRGGSLVAMTMSLSG